jgi:hypothetical protein
VATAVVAEAVEVTVVAAATEVVAAVTSKGASQRRAVCKLLDPRSILGGSTSADSRRLNNTHGSRA